MRIIPSLAVGAILIGPALSLHAQDRSNWSSVGPSYIQGGTGRVMSITFDPNNPSIIYAGTPSGGLWRFDPFSNSWKVLTDGLPSLGVSDIAVNPQTANEIFILTGDGFPFTASLVSNTVGVMKSTDGGVTRASTGLSAGSFTRGRRLLMDPVNTSVLLAATDAGLFRTSDAGASWSLVQTGSFFDCQFKPSDHNVLYAVFTDLSTAVERSESAPGHEPIESGGRWPTSVLVAASVHRASRARVEAPL